MIDCFLCFGDYSHLSPPIERFRNQAAQLCYERWKMQEDVHVRLLSGSGREFQRQRRIQAENESEEKFYLLADDDCLIEPFTIHRMLAVMEAHPEFAILSAWPKNCNIAKWTPPFYRPHSDKEVEEHVSVGGIRMMRADVMTEWPSMPEGFCGYDGIQADWLRARDWRVGYFRNIGMVHLGEHWTSLR